MEEVLSADVIRLVAALEEVYATFNIPQYVYVRPCTYNRLQHARAMGLAYERKRAKRKPTFRQRLEQIARKRRA